MAQQDHDDSVEKEQEGRDLLSEGVHLAAEDGIVGANSSGSESESEREMSDVSVETLSGDDDGDEDIF